MSQDPTMPGPEAVELASFLREQTGGAYELIPLAGGANNRVFRLPRPDGDWVLKCYFRNPGDPRDRFGAERAFYDWIRARGIRRTPEPLAWNPKLRLGLFTHVPGRKLRPEEVDAARLQEALDFLLELNAARAEAAAGTLPNASEACFSLEEHLACVDRRIARLQQIEAAQEVEREAQTFVRDELTPGWSRVRSAIVRNGAEGSRPIVPEHRCLSPSDFGFHNALLHPDGSLRFFDFEYAGWDDPAKTICDFFCQPELSVDPRFWEEFGSRLTGGLKADPDLPMRAGRLWPAYRVKWCCIMLNEFVRSEQSRRTFSAGTEVSEERRALQIFKARNALRSATESLGA